MPYHTSTLVEVSQALVRRLQPAGRSVADRGPFLSPISPKITVGDRLNDVAHVLGRVIVSKPLRPRSRRSAVSKARPVEELVGVLASGKSLKHHVLLEAVCEAVCEAAQVEREG
eukprot:CAMPEP_0173390126 /NCGR_PEP_ID=MMETSP1356-20130122/14309_1 /TAXON_ID=77927 ORGANISM="Hemiselmis virescens, Strain PCC157" /NCGR_SAMPLE_ID=MMETSP1356 /ASSEMBLY_ACC=CAM_ASM_000847 /LENGTH=113 /DNA_ID=CAMNT_0014347449 /DNA_START=358 /DNA_END=695 /DNA_ORIENTATION=+